MENHLELKKQIKDFLKSPFAWPGGYEIRPYFSDGETICIDCFKKEIRNIIQDSLISKLDTGWRIIGFSVNWEGPSEYCVQCGKELPSEYGDPNVENKED